MYPWIINIYYNQNDLLLQLDPDDEYIFHDKNFDIDIDEHIYEDYIAF